MRMHARQAACNACLPTVVAGVKAPRAPKHHPPSKQSRARRQHAHAWATQRTNLNPCPTPCQRPHRRPQASGGMQLSNGSWSGVMGQLVGGDANMAMLPLTLTSSRSKYISSTSPFMDNGYAMLVKLEVYDNFYSFLLPFQVRTPSRARGRDRWRVESGGQRSPYLGRRPAR